MPVNEHGETCVAPKTKICVALAWCALALGLFLATQAPLAGLAGGMALASVGLRDGFRISRRLEAALSIATVGLGIAASAPTFLPEAKPSLGLLGSLAPPLALSATLLGTVRLGIRHPMLGAEASLGLLVLALVGLGEAQLGVVYVALVALIGAAVLPTLPGAPTPWAATQGLAAPRLSLRGRALCVASLVAMGFAAVLPILYDKAAAAWVPFAWSARTRTGLAGSISLGPSVELESDESIVLRVRGDRVDHLRGAVLQRYRRGHWVPQRGEAVLTPLRERQAPPVAQPPPTAVAELLPVLPTGVWPLPLDSTGWVLPKGAKQDAYGVFVSASQSAREPVSFGLGFRTEAQPKPPEPADLEVPEALRPALEGLAKAWIPEETESGPSAAPEASVKSVAAIINHLQSDYRYATSSQRASDGDPVIDFLTQNPEGHCEYFASALALLARSLGIPARVVLGYRVLERNPWSGWSVVRQRDAHAWVELWLPEQGWVVRDPTPPVWMAERGGERQTLWTTLADLAAWEWQQSEPVILHWTLGMLAALGAILGFQRRWRSRKGEPSGAAEIPDQAPRELVGVLALLERQGMRRRPSEPLEWFVERLAPSDASRALGFYLAHRFGGQGDWETVATALRAVISKGPQ